ncbi:phenylalanine--tRNA ligase subunit beta [Candidatus Venteria ishoeyi]|uniref:Phenylalanine--tRNA ligase beta subunit n=1 Tax=Candidatus Venteria ishoeyi TaxID=1899563 RepID=A0A1H6FHG0_9GAMM|nr:phenylalanine--tRNA ligase subunit beta [Candidatus Venteria ishoeyi]SEH08799.1 Phenylalanine--tRNA ligase beta subunit [Candidatus Venteria ishoeyi]
MKFSEQWLRTWVNPAIDTAALVEQLTMAGLEVDGVEPVASDFSQILVGEVLEINPHPDAKKLQICKVNVNADEALQIVCGAANVHVGMRAPTAVVGAQLPGFKIKQAKLRGVESFGMLCSASELGLEEQSSGLLALPADAPIGQDIREYLQLDDVAIEVDLTPNRSDCLSLLGIAREVDALNRCGLNIPDIMPIPATTDKTFPLDIQQPQACPHYVGRVISGIQAQAVTPLWMQERLRRSGLRSLSPVVDVTNYVMLELGQPMHAFDLAKLSGGIQVRNANANEKLTLLDGQELKLNADTLVIADNNKVLALAGVMGGEGSGVADETTDIFLESAFFTPEQLAGCARAYGLHTDSSHRFERGVDPELQATAIERATALLLKIVGGEAGPLIEATQAEALPELKPISLRASRIKRVLGAEISAEDIEQALTRLGLAVVAEENGQQWQVTPTSFRFDIRLEADLIEEIARIYGYNQLPSEMINIHAEIEPPPSNLNLQQLQQVLVQRGYQEAITYSFVDPKLQAQFTPQHSPIALANPLASDLSVMRTSLWPGLIQAFLRNQKRQQADVRLFETGLRFIYDNEQQLQQQPMLAAVISGSVWPEQWGAPSQAVDFFDLKGDVENLLHTAGITAEFVPSTHPALHPGQAARLMVEGESLGEIGALHPQLAKQLDIDVPVYVFELALEPLLANKLPVFQALSKFPSIRRDLALLVDKDQVAADIINCIKQNAGELLSKLELFDIYQGEGIDSQKKSLALGLTFRASSRNLTEAEVEPVIEQVLQHLQQDFDASLRF